MEKFEEQRNKLILDFMEITSSLLPKIDERFSELEEKNIELFDIIKGFYAEIISLKLINSSLISYLSKTDGDLNSFVTASAIGNLDGMNLTDPDLIQRIAERVDAVGDLAAGDPAST